ncbi:MAG TPA: GAF domain-containing sensor histidine kinase [Thermoanaerobaculia bacterium]|nr:GAF domain-containing sensor histidine kinase [Thermoanaerobaculia bacterium]
MSAAVPHPQYALPDFSMTLRRLKLIAVVLPVLGVIALEIGRYFLVGVVSWEKRIALDLLFVAAIVIFAAVIFRFVEQMQEQLKRQNSELLALHSAGLDVTAELSLDVVLKKVVEQARNLVGAQYGALSVVDRENRILSFITAGITPEERAAIGPPPVGHGLLGVVLRDGAHLRLKDITHHPHSHGFPSNHPPMKSLLAVPIPCQGPFLGNLYLTEKSGGAEFTRDDEETLERFALQAALAIDNAHLHEQVADLAIAQERLRIAHEMHDGLAQVLGYVNTKVQAAEMYMKREKTEEAGTQLRELSSAARQAYSDVRESIVGLRALPGPQRSLEEVLREYLQQWEEMSRVETTLTLAPGIQLRASQELQLVRIVQEALTNVRKHAKASHARIDLRVEHHELIATIADDGHGFNAAARQRGQFPQFGLSTMRERAESIGGTLEIDSTPGGGTTVRFTLPLHDTEITPPSS